MLERNKMNLLFKKPCITRFFFLYPLLTLYFFYIAQFHFYSKIFLKRVHNVLVCSKLKTRRLESTISLNTSLENELNSHIILSKNMKHCDNTMSTEYINSLNNLNIHNSFMKYATNNASTRNRYRKPKDQHVYKIQEAFS